MPVGSKRLLCDFSAMRGARAVRLTIFHVDALSTSSPHRATVQYCHKLKTNRGHKLARRIAMAFSVGNGPSLARVARRDSSARRGRRQTNHFGERVQEGPSGNSQAGDDKFSGASCVKTHIRSGWMEMMRGELNGIEGRRKDKQIRRRSLISNSTEASLVFRGAHGADAAAAESLLSWNCFLFCLTGAAIFDNRHGLLKKFDSARAAKPLSQPLKPHE
jgi:hypothetical protein